MTIQRLPTMWALGVMVYATSSTASIEDQTIVDVQTQNSLPFPPSAGDSENDIAWVEFAMKAMPGRSMTPSEAKASADIFWSLFE